MKKNQKGFTIIEVLIVLAIAGLIMLIVFLAVPALQRNSRNNARNNEASRISAAVTECLANRNGLASACNDYSKINVGTLQVLTPVNPNQSFSIGNDVNAPTSGNTSAFNVGFGRVCTAEGDASTATGASTRDFVVMYNLEGTGTIVRCIGSQ
jgi:prepilin-type N-terminal cleavage/methylation domain-containing protein